MAKLKLTDDYIRTRERPAKGNVIDYDTEAKGLAVRFTPKGIPTFLYCYGSGVAGGSARRMVIGPWSDASGKRTASLLPAMRKEAIRLAGLVAAKRDPYKERQDEEAEREAERQEREREAAEAEAARVREAEEAEAARKAEEARLTFDQLCSLYLHPQEGAGLRPDTMRRTQARMKRHLRPKLGERKADEVTQDDVLALIKPLRKAGKRCEVVHVVTLISALYAWGMTEKRVTMPENKNPAEGILAILDKAEELPDERERVLSKASEYRAFWHVTDPLADVSPGTKMHTDVAECLRLILFTGARPSEAAGLKWAEIDMEAAVWNKPKQGEGRSKSKRGDALPLIGPAMAILRARAESQRANAPSSYVFPSGRNRDDGSEGCLTANRLATGLRGTMPYMVAQGVEPFTPHDVRRTVATGMGDIGVADDLVELTLNHAVRKLKKTYDKSRKTQIRRRAMTAWADYFAKVMRTGKTIDDWEDDELPQTDNVLQFPSIIGGR